MPTDQEYRCVYLGDTTLVRAVSARRAAVALAMQRHAEGDQQASYGVRVTLASDRAAITAAFIIDRYEVDPHAPEPKHIPRKSRAPLTPRVSRSNLVSRYTSEHDDIS